ncbi:MAG: hypothetical protein ABS36_07265 [Acidobacteria bacterium SCN 69-37]|mgnify:CR=1 FL=1|nr:MAG: hypothetical protein ABS36_07265 [Acidobacteria bacterium SCN 69-37]
MTHAARLTIAVLFVLVVGTANSAGYRFGVSDQAFYVPAVSLRADPSLFPRDRAVFEPQMRFWVGDEILGTFVRVTGIGLPALFAALYVVTMATLAIAVIALARRLGCDWWTIAIALVLLTLRHRIAKTGANSLEGYMHPRMLAFACGIVALASIGRLRFATAAVWTLVAALVHTSTAIWFGGVVAVAAAWPHRRDLRVRIAALSLVVIAVVFVAVSVRLLPRMDPAWLAVLGDRDYLFSAAWPASAWAVNLAYPIVLLAIYRRRVATGATVAGEAGLVAGLLALVVAFLVTVPLAELRVAFFVQLQANRIFWLLDAAVAIYVAWWIVATLMVRWPVGRRAMVIGALAVLAVARGAYVLHETHRPIAQVEASADEDWLRVMQWLRDRPSSWHVLADPGHAWKYGISVRAAALRDTPLELGKDPAMAMYDRALALRVAERTVALGDFDAWSDVGPIRQADRRYDIDVFVDRTDRAFPLPVLYRNASFVVYDLR